MPFRGVDDVMRQHGIRERTLDRHSRRPQHAKVEFQIVTDFEDVRLGEDGGEEV